MEKSQEKIRVKIMKKVAKFPDNPGVYFFLNRKKETMYIGKATSLRSRVRSYFSKDIVEKRSNLIGKMVFEATDIKFEQTDSVLEALILEAELIKKHLPPYNSAGKDQKSWNFVVVTKEKFPRVLVMRERELAQTEDKFIEKFGPFTNGGQLRIALKIVRKIFPFRDKCPVPRSLGGVGSDKPCFNYQIGLCPGTCVGKISEAEYKKTIKNIILFFKGKKKILITELEKEMRGHAKAREFEEAEEIKRKIFALKHIEDISLIKKDRPELSDITSESPFRIEAYDIAHISGTDMVGVFTVIEDQDIKKSDYRMFKIKGQKNADDTKALREVLSRRLNHREWNLPDLIVVDGGVAQLNATQTELDIANLKIPVVAVTKDDRHKPLKIQDSNNENKQIIEERKREILLANSEAHRFAISFHRKLRSKKLFS